MFITYLWILAWQGNFEQWITDPIHIRPIAHSIWDPHFGSSAVDAFSKFQPFQPVNFSYSGVYHWWYSLSFFIFYNFSNNFSLISFICFCLGFYLLFNLILSVYSFIFLIEL